MVFPEISGSSQMPPGGSDEAIGSEGFIPPFRGLQEGSLPGRFPTETAIMLYEMFNTDVSDGLPN